MKSCESTSNLFTSILRRSSTARLGSECGGFDEVLKEYARREVNVILWVSLIAVTGFLLRKLFKLFWLWIKASNIPGPPCDSFFGHTQFSGSSRSFIDILSELHNRYGSVLKLWLSPTQLLVSVKDPALAREMLLKAEDKLPLSGKAFNIAFGRSSLFFCPYDQAQKKRESLALELNEKLLGRGNAIPENVVDCIMERIDKSMGFKGSIDCKLASQRIAFSILGTTLFGDAFLTWSKAAFYEDLLMMIVKDAAFWASYRVTPFWNRGFWSYQSLCSKLKCLTQDIVQQCRRNYKLFCSMNKEFLNEVSKRGIKNAYGILNYGAMMRDTHFSQELEGHPDAKEESFVNVMGVMYHGCAAMSGLISIILKQLATNPDIQNKIYSEITGTTLGPKKDRSANTMVLLLATIYESARLLPVGPMLQRCSPRDDLHLANGVTIPAGAILVVPVQLLQKDNSIWGDDGSVFNPFRFLTEIGKERNSVQGSSSTDDDEVAQTTCRTFILNDPNENDAYLPFGSGIRACVGQKFVVQGVANFLSSLLRRYEVSLQPAREHEPKSSATDIVFKRRNN